MSTLERAIIIAAQGHAGVKDKGGAPYILHPLRMMLGLSSPDERIVVIARRLRGLPRLDLRSIESGRLFRPHHRSLGRGYKTRGRRLRRFCEARSRQPNWSKRQAG
jgi:hypothetical protein